jgi:hypothetical protein
MHDYQPALLLRTLLAHPSFHRSLQKSTTRCAVAGESRSKIAYAAWRSRSDPRLRPGPTMMIAFTVGQPQPTD